MLFALALIPVIGLLCFIYFNDKKEKEPFWLLVILFFAGMSTVLSAWLLETVGQLILEAAMPYGSVLKNILEAMIIVGPAEELGKFLVLWLITWKNKHFNYSYDAFVYAVFVSLGFAAIENVGYVAMSGIGTALMRMFTAVPGHACFAVFMGLFYSKAKYASLTNKKGKSIVLLLLAYLIPSVVHGIYDAILMAGGESGEIVLAGLSLLLWIGFCIAMFVSCIIIIIKSSRRDFCIVTLPDEVQTVYIPSVIGSWTCICGSQNYLNFCPKCGRQRTYISAWNCPQCGTLSAFNFCGRCGYPKPVVQQPVMQQPVMYQQPIQQPPMY